MEKNIKKSAVASKTNLEFEAKATQGHARFPKANRIPVYNIEEIINNDLQFKETLSPAIQKAKPLLYQKADLESPIIEIEIEIHWMASAVYNQKLSINF